MNNKTATAIIKGSDKYPDIDGYVTFTEVDGGVYVAVSINGLPSGNGIHGFHIHKGYNCTGNSEDPFADSDGHFDLNDNKHPYHSGDMPPLFSNNGFAYMTFLTDRFRVDDIIGRVVIVHEKADDFTTQPSGNSGNKIACGKIE
ncbi:MAG: superoxide dismutase family protein [Lachnospirales bacterium]